MAHQSEARVKRGGGGGGADSYQEVLLVYNEIGGLKFRIKQTQTTFFIFPQPKGNEFT